LHCTIEDVLRDHRHLGPALLGHRDRQLELEDRREGLEQDQIDAGDHQRVDLLGQRHPRAPPLALGRDREAHAGGPDRAGHVGAAGGALAGQLDRGLVERRHLIGEAVAGQRDAVGAEGVGLDHLGAGVDVVAVDPRDQVGLGDHQLVVAAGVQHAAIVEQRAHRAVEQDRPFGQGVEEWLHRELGGVGVG
jgi:hypothetical protein